MQRFPDPLHDDYLDSAHCEPAGVNDVDNCQVFARHDPNAGAIWDDAGQPINAREEWEDSQGAVRSLGWALLIMVLFWGTVAAVSVAGFLEMWRW